MRVILIAAVLSLLSASAHSQQVTTGDTVNVPGSGAAGGQNATVWKADCQKGMVMTGIEIVVGGTCHNQCNSDGRPIAAYRIHCSQLQTGNSAKPENEPTR
jgi:ribosomal protein L24